jgi:hypothetical protein
MLRYACCLVLALLSAACLTTVQVGGYSMAQSRWIEDEQTIRGRAAFDLKCPAAQLEVVPVMVTNGPTYGIAQQIGASGCDRRAVYAQIRGGSWVLNSDTR